MLAYDFDESVGCWVALTSHALRRALGLELASEKITFRQWEVLAWISLCGEPSQVELADRMGIEAPTLAGLLSRMERDGWLERFGCSEDRRKKRLRATAKSESVWNRTVECCRKVRAQATRDIPPDDLAILKRTCETIRRNLGSADPNCGNIKSAPVRETVFAADDADG